MLKKAHSIAQDEAAIAVEAAVALAKSRVTALGDHEIDDVSGGRAAADASDDPGITAGLISPDYNG